VSLEIGTETGHCPRCHADVLIEVIATEGRPIDTVDGTGRAMTRHLVEVRTTPDTRAALEFHNSGRCVA
jgi:hypothetical protein